MDHVQRRNAEALFQEIVDLPADQRTQLLREKINGDDALRAEVESLLAHYDDGTMTSIDAGVQFNGGATELVGEVIGPYKLLQLIGQGGFGAVYMAEQTAPVRRKVALKIIKLGMDTRQVIARFEAERQALAMMDHPNIAKVFDAGATETGRPFFVMELVRGIPITRYCDKNNLSPTGRLLLFSQVCRAVQHAHTKGIIHRDLKPSNVMVTLHDGEPVPKIIDFGIAKATHQRLTEKTLFTEFRQFIGTPAYMSPEQAEMGGLDIDTRTDIYSLGVLLYELLTGTTPFDSKALRSKAYGEIQRIIREEEPPTPSQRVNTLLGDQLSLIARSRAMEPISLRKLIRGDLDWIVMKAMEKDRTRRYETANGIARDIERYLNHEPVNASPPSATYRLRKFVRKHRAGVAGAAVVTFALLCGLALAMVGFIRASQERDLARTAKIRADDEAARSRAISAFLQDMLAFADPMQLRQLSAFAIDRPENQRARGDATHHASVAEMVRRASSNIDEAFTGKPLLEATARETIGMTLRGLGFHGEARPQLEKAYALRRTHLGSRHPDALRSALALGDLLLDAGDADNAFNLIDLAYRGMHDLYGAEDAKTLSSAAICAMANAAQGEFAVADSMFEETLERQRRVLGPEHRDTLTTMWNWSVSYLTRWQDNEGQTLARELYDIARRALPKDDALNVLSKPLLGWWYLEQWQYDLAEAVFRPGLEQCRRILGEGHPFTLITMNGLARSLQGRERQPEIEELHRAALAGLLETRGRQHRHTISTAADFANWLGERGRFQESEQLYRDLLADCVAAYGEGDDYTLRVMQQFATALAAAGKLDEAVEVQTRRLEALRRRFGGANPVWFNVAHAQTQTLVRMGKLDAARDLMREIIDTTRDLAGKNPDNDEAVNNHAWFLLIAEPPDLRDLETALPLAQRAVELCDGKKSAILDTLALALHRAGRNEEAVATQTQSLALLSTRAAADLTYGANLVRYLLETGDTEAADQYVHKSIELFRSALGEDNPRLASKFVDGGISLTRAGHYKLAEPLLLEGLGLYRKLLGREHERVAFTLRSLADLYILQDRYDDAAQAFRAALAIRRRLLGDDHSATAATLTALAEALHLGGDANAAIVSLREALGIYRRLHVDDGPAAINACHTLARLLISSGRAEEAEPLVRRALLRTQDLYGPTHREIAYALLTAGRLSLARGNPRDAEAFLRRSIEQLQTVYPEPRDRWHVALAHCALGESLKSLERWREAEELLLTAYDALHVHKGDNYLPTTDALQCIVRFYEEWERPDQAAAWRTRAHEARVIGVRGAAREMLHPERALHRGGRA